MKLRIKNQTWDISNSLYFAICNINSAVSIKNIVHNDSLLKSVSLTAKKNKSYSYITLNNKTYRISNALYDYFYNCLNTSEVKQNHVRKPLKLLKWVGSKSKIINDIIQVTPKTVTNYYEPFLGSGAVLFGILQAKKRNYWI